MRALTMGILAAFGGCTWITDGELEARADLDGDGTPGMLDCDDHDPDHAELVDWYADTDGDGFGDAMAPKGFCQPPEGAGWSAEGTDCNDDDAGISPSAREVCNDVDDDCDGLFDDLDPDLDPASGTVYFPDGDGDSVAREAPTLALTACVPPGGYVVPPDLGAGEDWDCDDGDPGVFPGAAEVCNDLVDNDCDGLVDEEGAGEERYLRDADQDGYPPAGAQVQSLCSVVPGWVLEVTAPSEPDCDDHEATVHPSAIEVWYDGVDQDCDGNDLDRDGDGADYLVDCDDQDPTVSPLLPEVWYDGIDQDCDGADDYDQDGDSYRQLDDCDDLDAAIHPAAIETWYDGVDSSCHGRSDDDQDGDGADSQAESVTGDDCDDLNPLVFPLAAEIWYDGVDQDCDGADDFDQDGDGYPIGTLPGDDGGIGPVLVDLDCDDTDPNVNPEAVEDCGDGADNNCDGHIDDFGTGGTTQYRDADFDGWPSTAAASVCSPPIAGWVSLAPGPGTTDCDDLRSTIHPGMVEVWYDGVDQDCDGNDDDQDGDGDPLAGFSGGLDCDDLDPEVSSLSTEWCDDVDHDCSGDPLPVGDSVTALLADGSLADVRADVDNQFNATGIAAIHFCNGTFPVEILYAPGASLVLQGYGGATLEAADENLLSPLPTLPFGTGLISMIDLGIDATPNGLDAPMILVTSSTDLLAERLVVTRLDRTLFDAGPDSVLTLIDLAVSGGSVSDPLVLCVDCELDVQGGLLDAVSSIGFEVSGSLASASVFALIARDGTQSLVVAENGATVVMDEVEVRRGTVDVGAAVHVRSGGLVDITNATFDDNDAVTAGGAVYVEDPGSSAFLRGSSLSGNSAGGGGAIAVVEGTVQLIDVTVALNTADDGGGIQVVDGFLFSQNTLVLDNVSLGHGGGVRIDNGTLVSASDRLSGNQATSEGGGLYVSGGSAVGSLAGVVIENNVASGVGGGVAIAGRSVVFLSAESEIRGNVGSTGGGVSLDNISTFGSVDTDWSSNAPDDFQNQSWTPATQPEVILCSSGLPCLLL